MPLPHPADRLVRVHGLPHGPPRPGHRCRLARADEAPHHGDGRLHRARRLRHRVARGRLWTFLLAAALAGTGLVAAGASVLNQVLERDTDALMLRTRSRPVPARAASRPGEARAFGGLLTAAGLVHPVVALRAARGRRRSAHVGELPVRLHAAQAPHSARDAGRGRAGRPPPGHRVGRRPREPRRRGLHPVRDPLPVADPALPRHRVALPRRLRPSRLPDAPRARSRGDASRAARRSSTAWPCSS